MLFLNNWKGETMSKAQRIVDTYDEMRAKGESYYTRYDKALSAAEYRVALKSGTPMIGCPPVFYLPRIRLLNFRIGFLNSMMGHMSL